jgi:antitoxin ParD1/3/4
VPTRNVVLTDQQTRLIQSLVDSGRYQNACEVIREGLRLIERREADDATKLQALRAAAEIGTAALERGAFREFSDTSALREYLYDISDNALRCGQRSQ